MTLIPALLSGIGSHHGTTGFYSLWKNVQTHTIEVIFNEFFIFAEIGFQKGARN